MREPISEEQINTAIRLYKRKDLTLNEIANLVDLSTGSLTKIYRSAFRENKLKPRKPEVALKPSLYKEQGTTKHITGVGKGGRSHERKRFSDAEEKQIVKDYYENGYTMVKIQEKYGLVHPMQMQRIRNRVSGIYGKKKTRVSKPVLQFDKQGNFIAEYENGRQAGITNFISYQNINSCLNGRLASAGGFVWKYKES